MTPDATPDVFRLFVAALQGSLAKAKEAQSEGSLATISRRYLKWNATLDPYGPTGSAVRQQSQEVHKEEWENSQWNRFLEAIRHMPEYRACQEAVSQRFRQPELHFWHAFSRALQRMLTVPLPDPGMTAIGELASVLLGDLEGNPAAWQTRIFLQGLSLDDEHLELSGDRIIRRPQPADYERAIPEELVGLPGMQHLVDLASAIIEYRYTAPSDLAAIQEVERTIQVLQLFRLGCVHAIRYDLQPSSFRLIGATHRPNLRSPTPYITSA